MRKNITKVSNYMYNYISDYLSQGIKIAIPKSVLEQEGLDLDEMSDYYTLEKGHFGLVNFIGFRKAF